MVPYYVNQENGKKYIDHGVLNIPEGVIQIEENAFEGAKEIIELILPKSLSVIEDSVVST